MSRLRPVGWRTVLDVVSGMLAGWSALVGVTMIARAWFGSGDDWLAFSGFVFLVGSRLSWMAGKRLARDRR